MHSVDGLWNINDLQYIKLPEVIGAQDVRSILPLGEELWVGAGHWIVVLEKGSLVEKVWHVLCCMYVRMDVCMQRIHDVCVCVCGVGMN